MTPTKEERLAHQAKQQLFDMAMQLWPNGMRVQVGELVLELSHRNETKHTLTFKLIDVIPVSSVAEQPPTLNETT